MTDVARHTQFVRGDEDNFDVGTCRQRLDEGMDGTTELQVTAKTDGEVVEAAQLAGDGEQVGEGLCRVAVAAVTGVDDRHTGHFGGG